MIILGVDTGGTFTDFVLFRDACLSVHKVLSTPTAPEQAILTGISDLGLNALSQDLYVIHGSTVATNAVLENKGVRTIYITNRGLGDLLSIGRQARRELYQLQPVPYDPPVPARYCLETGGRLAADGSMVEDLTEHDLERLKSHIIKLNPKSVAINLLFSFLDDRFERQIEAIIPHHLYVSRSSNILPEHKEYERGIATWLNASVQPIVSQYLHNLKCKLQYAGSTKISVMQSSGGTIDIDQAAEKSINLMLSGPAGGLAGARYVAAQSNIDRLLTFDMGGTSTDVALIDGDTQLTTEGRIAGYPVAVPMVDMHTIGAGGGSIATVDVGGLLQVGPRSAGAKPGPACYGLGGSAATVTDANVILGRLQAENFLGGNMSLDVRAARAAIQPIADRLLLSLQDAALGIIQLVNENMIAALKVMSVQRGIDPKQLCLVSFGGAGGLHVCALANALNIRKALVPIHSGVLSALGMLVAPKTRHLSENFNSDFLDMDESILTATFDRLAIEAETALADEGVSKSELQRVDTVDVRYQGQSFYLSLLWRGREKTADHFHRQHHKRYGHRLNFPLQLVNARVKLSSQPLSLKFETPTLTVASDQASTAKILYGHVSPVPVYQRSNLSLGDVVTGPALIYDLVATTYVEKEWSFSLQESGSILLTRL